MDREAVARASGVIPPEKLAEFLEYLVREPERPKLCAGPHPTEIRLQGDFVADLPLCSVDAKGEPRVRPLTVALLNNTCDLQPGRSRFVNVAAVTDYPAFRSSIVTARGETKAQGFLSAIEGNKIAEMLFVKECPAFPEGAVIFLDKISTLSVELYEQALANNRRIASFTQNGFYVFLLKLANYFARAETPEVAREAV